MKRVTCSHILVLLLAQGSLAFVPGVANAATVANPNNTVPDCASNTAFFNPTAPVNINLPAGFRVSLFRAGLNAPTGIAFLSTGDGDKDRDDGKKFEIYVLESGHGLPSICNDEATFQAAHPHTANPLTPDILVFSSNGTLLRTLGKPTDASTETGGNGVFQPHGPAVDLAFENGLAGGRLFATDSNQATHAHNGQNNSSRIVTVNRFTGVVTPFITQLPTGDHPTEQLAFKGKWVYWSQGSTTNSGVVGLDNGGGQNQPDIPCQDIVLSKNVFDSGTAKTSGYSPFGTPRPGATVHAFEGASHHGVCDGAILRARLDAKNPADTIEPFSWGYRNGYAIAFAPEDHALKGGLLVGEDGPDERGARPSNGAPDVLQLAQQNDDGSPDYHGWPDRFGFLASSQAVFNPIGGPADDLCVFDATNPPSFCTPGSLAKILSEDVPIRDVLDHPPQPITSPLAIEAADSSFTGIAFAPKSFVSGPVERGAALYVLEGDFGFSAPNATDPAPEVGHELKLINFSEPGDPLSLRISQFAKNNTGDQAFVADGINGFNRPTNVRFGPDGCAWIVDYGAVRDLGSDSHFVGAANGPLVQVPGTGAIWRVCRQ